MQYKRLQGVIKALTALLGRLSQSVDRENGPERDLRLFHLTYNVL